MKFLDHGPAAVFALSLTAVFVGCGTPGAPMPPSLELPKPVVDLQATRKGNKVDLSWTVPTETTDLQNIRHLGPSLICRSLEVAMNQCGTPVGQLPASQLTPQHGSRTKVKKKAAAPPVRASYTDTLPPDLGQQNPTALVNYAVQSLNSNDRGAALSNQVQVPLAPTLPAPSDLKAVVTGRGVMLTWTGTLPAREIPAITYVYRVYRREMGNNNDNVASEIPIGNSAQSTLVDHSFEWEKRYDYRVTAVTVLSRDGQPPMQVEGDDSAPVRVFTQDTFPPAVPSGLEAVSSGVGQQPFIDLTWAPDTDSDLAGYNLYRHEEGSEPAKINPEPVKTPAFRDSNVAAGKKYFYSVSAVDLRGNESARSQETSEAVPGDENH